MAKLQVLRFTNRGEAERYYLREIDRRAELARVAIITAAPGQSMTYEAKHQEALAGDGPFLRAEADSLGVTVAEVIDSVLAARARWEEAGARIEATRLKAKKQIRETQTPAEMHAITRAMQEEQ